MPGAVLSSRQKPHITGPLTNPEIGVTARFVLVKCKVENEQNTEYRVVKKERAVKMR